MKKSLVLFCLLFAACTTGSIEMRTPTYVPDISFDANGERHCGLVMGHHKNWLGNDAPDEFVADINVWWGTSVGTAEAQAIVADANARLLSEGYGGLLLACSEANAVEMAAKIHTGASGKGDKALKEKVAKTETILRDLIKELQGQEKKAREGAAAPAAPAPSGDSVPAAPQPGGPPPAAAAPAAPASPACAKIVGATSFADLSAGFTLLASGTTDAASKERLVKIASSMKKLSDAGGSNDSLPAYKQSFASYCK